MHRAICILLFPDELIYPAIGQCADDAEMFFPESGSNAHSDWCTRAGTSATADRKR